ncbi:hypothetical protein HIM_09728 [Hirsutella minnesotensis 3608]|uniref:SGNH hydrolase-type esterase domain-containing protein n=1 Tax=Hirsutella minnesotensis 3608 TaxID=1043627 RepID=A0A0F7ZS73_9HYPO|nr:hypothetical protein HIM_09728 [Hirsutella minnesotensis 3608]
MRWLYAAILPAFGASSVMRGFELNGATALNALSIFEKRADDDAIVFDFVKRWAAIGDSFTAGIGSGSRLGLPPVGSADWLCSRYSYTWPKIVDRAIGSQKTDFQYPACSGDRTGGIYEQAKQLEGDLHVVMMTAGGNDLCLTKSPLLLTVDRRKKFNKLVENINRAIRDVVKEFQEDRHKKFDIEFSDWSAWPAAVDGQMCSPSSDGRYPDPNQPELQFFKPDTYVEKTIIHDGLRRRDAAWMREPGEEDFSLESPEDKNGTFEAEIVKDGHQLMGTYDSLLYKSRDPRAAALHALDARAPKPPVCPGDGSFDPTLGLGLPDTFGKIFHPNKKGHETIAAFALLNLAHAKAAQGGKGNDICQVDHDKFVCWQSEGRRAWVSYERADANYRDFCDNLEAPKNTLNWRREKTYHKGTPEEMQFVIQLSEDTSSFDVNMCKESFDRIINSCDGNDSRNPMNGKFGGKWLRGGYTFELNPKKDRALYLRPDGACRGRNSGIFDTWVIWGLGWAGHDWGQKTLLPAIRGCVGVVTKWEFEYFDNTHDNDGWEWRASFWTAVATHARCFNNLKVVAAAGGYTHKWKRKRFDEESDDFGCTWMG